MEKPYDPEVTPSAWNLPPFSQKEPYNQQTPPAHALAPPAIPIQHHPNYVLASAVPSQGSDDQRLHHTDIIVPKEPIYEPDYLSYSFFTLLCCLPLGIAALCFSIRTKDANHDGNSTKARWNSKVARGLATTALGFGILSIVVTLVFLYYTGRI